MTSSHNAASVRLTVLYAILTTFFIQLLTIWIESTYRMALIKTSMGLEIFGLLLIFLPLLLFVAPSRSEAPILHGAFTLFVVSRLLCDVAGASAGIAIAGFGVGAGLILLCFVLSSAYAELRDSLPGGIVLGLLLAVFLRSWGSSYDITFGGPGVLFTWILAAAAVLLALRHSHSKGHTAAEQVQGSLLAAILAAMGWFANIAIVYMVLSSPAVISAWANTNYLANTVCIGVSWTLATYSITRGQHSIARMSRPVLVVWNLAFAVTLIVGIRLQTVTFPATPASPAVVAYPASMGVQIVFYVMLLLSPVVLANVLHLLQRTYLLRPRAMALPLILGALMLLIVTLMAIFTNVWGYVGDISAPLRNRFFLPYLVTAIAMQLPYVASQPSARQTLLLSPVAMPIAGLLVLLSVCGIAVRGWPKAGTGGERRLTVLTYNIQLGSEEQGDRNYRDQLAFIKRVSPDIIGLQESDSARPGGGNVDVGRYFAESLGYYYYYGPNTISGTFGTAIVSRYPIENPRTVFSYSDKDETGTAVAEIDVQGTHIALLNSHPAGSDDNFQRHADAVLEAAAPYQYVIATGDYNSRPGSANYNTITSRLKDSWVSLYPDGIGKRHPKIGHKRHQPETIDMSSPIDHIFITPNFSVEEAYYVPAPESETDHPAHWVTLTWN